MVFPIVGTGENWLSDFLFYELDGKLMRERHITMTRLKDPVGWVAISAFAAGMVGAVLPWAHMDSVIGSITLDGMDADGKYMFIFALIGIGGILLGLIKKKLGNSIALAISVLMLLTSVMDIQDVSSTEKSSVLNAPDVGIGLWVCLVASVLAGLSSAVRLFRK